jgi:hypothetical protein
MGWSEVLRRAAYVAPQHTQDFLSRTCTPAFPLQFGWKLRVVDHIGSGGVTMVAVKPPSSAENIAYRLLGFLAALDRFCFLGRLC